MKPEFKRIYFLAITLLIASYTITRGQCSEFYGMTSEGGKFNGGSVFKFNRNSGKLETIKNFEIQFEGKNPYSDLCLANNGKFYGMTYAGGEYNLGVLFEWDPVTNIYINKLDFNGAEKGARPMGSLIKAKNGMLYGMTSEGGSLNYGVLFEWDTDDNLYVKKLDFPDDAYRRGIGDIMQAEDGKFYGLNYGGSIFEWDPMTNIYKLRFHFNEYTTGYFPLGKLTQAGNGKLYGTAQYGGKNQCGTVFNWDPVSGIFTLISDFDPSTTLKYPSGALVLADNGKLYGMCEGRTNGDAIYEVDPATNEISKKLEFNYFEMGQFPHGPLIRGNNGKLYGMTYEGGSYDSGLLFEWDPVTNHFSKKVDFKPINVGFYITPNSLSQTSDGRFYGLYSYGGYDNTGFLFEWDTTSTILTQKFSFNYAADGRLPMGDLVLSGNGKLYGMTSYGGMYDDGVIFEIDTTTQAFVKKFDFKLDTTGGNPSGSLMLAKNGNLYGMTDNGGKNGDGVIFEWDPLTERYSIKIEFEAWSMGSGSKNRLIEGSNHLFYGVTENGGIHYRDSRGGLTTFGVIFEWDPVSNVFSKKFDFDYMTGNLPFGAPIRAGDGKFYGQTTSGGSNYGGVIYSWDPLTESYHVEHNFAYQSVPNGSLNQAGNGKLYGLTSSGGSFSKGVLYEFDPINNNYAVKVNFDGISKGARPVGSLVQAGNGKLYGLTQNGGELDKGVLFEWDPSTGDFHKLIDFKGSENGSLPYGSLMKVRPETSDTIYAEACRSYLTPSGKYTFTTSGVYKDFLTSSTGGDSVLTIILKIKSTTSHASVIACKTYTSPSGRYKWTNSGNYTDTIPNKAACDSIIMVNLSILRSKSTIYPVACESFTSPSGRYTWTQSGKYTDTIPNAAGCDSIITLNLTVHKPSSSTLDMMACDKYNFNGKILTSSGTYYDTIPNAAGCDSIITVNLTIGKSTSFIQQSACDTYTSPSGRYTWISTGTYLDTIPNAAGCDSLITIDLQVDHVDTTVIQDRTVLISNDRNASHQWIDCGNGKALIEGETYLTFTSTASGSYAVIVSNGACIDTSSCYDIMVTGLTELPDNIITLYPNPTNGSFTINLARTCVDAAVTVTASDGQIIQRKHVRNAQTIELYLNAPPGLYMVTIAAENKYAIKKLVKN